jgi:hypothetical protein
MSYLSRVYINIYRDYLKFTTPLAHALLLLNWGAIEWFEAYDRANLTDYLKETIMWGTDWLMLANPEPNVLYVQVSSNTIVFIYTTKEIPFILCYCTGW